MLLRRPRLVCASWFGLAWACFFSAYTHNRIGFDNYGAYELLLTNSQSVDQMDMVNDAVAIAADSAAAAAAADSSADSAAAGAAAATAGVTTRTWARSRPAAEDFSVVLLFTTHGTKRVFTPSLLQHVCRIENIALGLPEYDRLCLNAPLPIPGTSSTSARTGRKCSAQLGSPSAFFYVDWAAVLPIQTQLEWLREYTPASRLFTPPAGVSVTELLRAGSPFEYGRHTRSCPRLSPAYVRAREAQLYAALNATAAAAIGTDDNVDHESLRQLRVLLAPLVDARALRRGFATATASTLTFGAPVHGYASESDRPVEQLRARAAFEAAYANAFASAVNLRRPTLFASPWRGRAVFEADDEDDDPDADTDADTYAYADAATNAEADTNAVRDANSSADAETHNTGSGVGWVSNSSVRLSTGRGLMEVLYLGSVELRKAEAVALAERSVAWASGSVFLVFVLMALHLRSISLAAVGMTQILTAIPIALRVYAGIVPITAAISSLAVFVLIGIGADDLFVLTDVWRRLDPEAAEEARLAVALRRAGAALLTTSATTAVGFFSLVLTPLPVVSALGIFAGVSIVVDLVLTLSLYPCMLVLWERHQQGASQSRALAACTGAANNSVSAGSDQRYVRPVAPLAVTVAANADALGDGGGSSIDSSSGNGIGNGAPKHPLTAPMQAVGADEAVAAASNGSSINRQADVDVSDASVAIMLDPDVSEPLVAWLRRLGSAITFAILLQPQAAPALMPSAHSSRWRAPTPGGGGAAEKEVVVTGSQSMDDRHNVAVDSIAEGAVDIDNAVDADRGNATDTDAIDADGANDAEANAIAQTAGVRGLVAIRIKPVAVCLVLLLGGIAAWQWVHAWQLQLPRVQEGMLMYDHMFRRAGALLDADARARSGSGLGSAVQLATLVPGAIWFGLRSLDRSEASAYVLDHDRGRVVWDEELELSDPQTQRWLLRLAAAVRAEGCTLEWCTPPLLVLPHSAPFFLEAFALYRLRQRTHTPTTRHSAMPTESHDTCEPHHANANAKAMSNLDTNVKATTDANAMVGWCNLSALASALPSGPESNFSAALAVWLKGPGAGFASQVGLVNERVRWVALRFISTSSGSGGPYAHWLALQKLWEQVLARELAHAPPALRRGFAMVHQHTLNPTLGRREITSCFAVSATYPKLYASLRKNLLAAVGIGFLCLALSSGSCTLAAIATFTVAAIIASVLGMLKLAGVSLGIKQMCGGAVVVGFSFDYSLHLACAYAAAPPTYSRDSRVRHAAVHMGPTLIGGALTTLGSILFMLGTDFPFLIALAQMVSAAVLLSVVYALGFFLPLCALVGPTWRRTPTSEADGTDSNALGSAGVGVGVCAGVGVGALDAAAERISMRSRRYLGEKGWLRRGRPQSPAEAQPLASGSSSCK